MFSLILAFLTIAFLSALAVVAINYAPWWASRAQIAQELTSGGMATLERAYELASANATPADTPPAPMPSSDGGLQALLGPYAGFIPRAPHGMSWSYGRQSAAGTFEGLDYICLQGPTLEFAEYQGVQRQAQIWGSTQAILASSCGAVAATAAPASFPATVALTYYLQYVPGVN